MSELWLELLKFNLEKMNKEQFLEKYKDLSQEDLLEKLYNSEQANIENKKKTKESKSENDELLKRIEELEKGSKKSELDDFLKDKNLSDDEKKIFEEKVNLWNSKEDAYFLATREKQEISQKQEQINKNTIDWEDVWDSNTKSIKYSELAELPQEQYNLVADKIDSWKIKVISE